MDEASTEGWRDGRHSFPSLHGTQLQHFSFILSLTHSLTHPLIPTVIFLLFLPLFLPANVAHPSRILAPIRLGPGLL
jgi:hypothetical protein